MLSDGLTYADSSNRLVKYDQTSPSLAMEALQKRRGDHPSLSFWGPNSNIYPIILCFLNPFVCDLPFRPRFDIFSGLPRHRSHNFILHML